ncbi:isoamylase early set domain-containing protein [Micromonospora harpali]|uniref:Glycogen recognition site of AMP-activated protein kinase n=2 Tax=Micromonospora TaxID=1873 RepID=A0A1C4V0G3_9ACTN|nr:MULTISPECIES: isoamylase early set domain-containing protein [Micromonospora]MDI5941949.1 isoamylase early set domain-containing protein [Micromonospora sp. DH15]OON31424.1 glycoside hydrolase [Micromonospora sp. Rc5]SCE77407.1 Glycogen recognition site of AMP-activated protein kinase [Micromonospora haikouensis]
MIKRSRLFGNQTRVTFCLPREAPAGPVSVVGSFNDWEPGRHELVARRDGTRTVTVRLRPGAYRFRYLATGGIWLDDESADGVDEQGSVLLV